MEGLPTFLHNLRHLRPALAASNSNVYTVSVENLLLNVLLALATFGNYCHWKIIIVIILVSHGHKKKILFVSPIRPPPPPAPHGPFQSNSDED